MERAPELAAAAVATAPPSLDLRRDAADAWERLLPFQRQGVAFALAAEGRILLADEMGLGKTAQAIIIAAHFADEWPLLVVCPTSMRYVWAAELERWLPTGLAPALVHLCEGRAFGVPPGAAVVVATYSLFEGWTGVAESVAERGFRVVVADESHYLRTSRSKRTRTLAPVLRRARRLVLLSGTPALARPVELHAQLAALSPADFGDFRAFTVRYCDGHRGRFGWDTSGASNLGELHGRLRPMMLRRRKAEVLDQLPRKRRQLVRIDIAAARRAEMREAMAELNRLRVGADALVESEGPSRRDAFERRRLVMETWRRTGEAKADMAAQYLQDLLKGSEVGHKVLFFAHHRLVLDSLSTTVARGAYGAIRIDGEVSPAERQRRVTQFQEDPAIRVALLSVTAAGQGLTLTAASTVVFAELHWTPGVLLQAEDRAHRMGQRASVQVIYLVCLDRAESLDHGIWRMLAKKSGVVGHAVDGCGGKWAADDGFAAGEEAEELRAFFAGVAESAAARRREAEAAPVPGAPRSDIRALLTRRLQPHPAPVLVSGSDDSGAEGAPAAASHAPARCEEERAPPAPRAAPASGGHVRPPWEAPGSAELAGPFAGLKFSVSPHTGRVSLHHALTGAPMGLAFDVAALGEDGLGAADAQVQAFAREWRRLRAPERKELCGRLLTLPLHAALDAARATGRWTAKGPSEPCFERRALPGAEAEAEPPALRCCGWCRRALPGAAPAPGRLSQAYCDHECWVEARIRGAFQASVVRRELFALEHGVCQLCGLDAHALFERVRALAPPERHQKLLGTRFRPTGAVTTAPKEEHFWQADHILAVAEGGGQCPLGNFRTLCTPCHAVETRKLRHRLAAKRRSVAAGPGAGCIRGLFAASARKRRAIAALQPAGAAEPPAVLEVLEVPDTQPEPAGAACAQPPRKTRRGRGPAAGGDNAAAMGG